MIKISSLPLDHLQLGNSIKKNFKTTLYKIII